MESDKKVFYVFTRLLPHSHLFACCTTTTDSNTRLVLVGTYIHAGRQTQTHIASLPHLITNTERTPILSHKFFPCRDLLQNTLSTGLCASLWPLLLHLLWSSCDRCFCSLNRHCPPGTTTTISSSKCSVGIYCRRAGTCFSHTVRTAKVVL